MKKKRSKKKRETKAHPSANLPVKAKVEAGCYIDFEGFAANDHRRAPPPVLIGIYNFGGNGQFKQVVFTEDYRWAAEDPNVEHAVFFEQDRDAFLQELVSSVRKNKPLFAYSEHELRVIQNCVKSLGTSRYRNVRTIAKKWLNQRKDTHSQPETLCLRDVAKVMKIALPKKLAEGGVTSRLREVREHSKTKKAWASAPTGIRRMWREVLEHNRCDVMSIRELMLHM